MKSLFIKAFGLGVALGLIVATAPSCGPVSACDASSCANGCCANGQCLSGTSTSTCGTGGNRCNACGTSQVCKAGACGVAFTGGGQGGGSGGGGGGTVADCGPSTCATGCCANNHCLPGTALDGCGIGGATCAVCTSAQTCSQKSCVNGATPDAGMQTVDSGTQMVDSGVPDSGTVVVDSGVADAGLAAVDAGVIDSGVIDAGMTVFDAGAVDAGMPIVDAGVCDPSVVISQVYGGGGNTGAPYKADFVELHNRSNRSVDISTWSIQYASASGSSWQVAPLSGSIAAGGFVLVSLFVSASGADLPTPNITSTSINLSALNGKVALVTNATAIAAGTSCPSDSSVTDFLGYGSANCADGTPALAATSSVSVRRLESSGPDLSCTSTHDNSIDFELAGPTPQTSATTPNICSVCR